jgi:RNA polymerase sigma factor (sigma-70 family)
MKNTMLGKEYTDGRTIFQEKDRQEVSPEISDWLEQLLRMKAERFFTSAGFPPAFTEDLVQEAFLRLSRVCCHGIQANLDYWHKICLSVKNDHLRRQRDCPPLLPLEDAFAEETATDLANQIINRVWYMQCLETLNETERSIVQLHIEMGYTFIEIARQIERKPDCVKKIYQRTIVKLREREISDK